MKYLITMIFMLILFSCNTEQPKEKSIDRIEEIKENCSEIIYIEFLNKVSGKMIGDTVILDIEMINFSESSYYTPITSWSYTATNSETILPYDIENQCIINTIQIYYKANIGFITGYGPFDQKFLPKFAKIKSKDTLSYRLKMICGGSPSFGKLDNNRQYKILVQIPILDKDKFYRMMKDLKFKINPEQMIYEKNNIEIAFPYLDTNFIEPYYDIIQTDVKINKRQSDIINAYFCTNLKIFGIMN